MRVHSRAEASERPKPARERDAAAAVRPASGEPSAETAADSTITASRTAPASRLRLTADVTETMSSPLTRSTQRSA